MNTNSATPAPMNTHQLRGSPTMRGTSSSTVVDVVDVAAAIRRAKWAGMDGAP